MVQAAENLQPHIPTADEALDEHLMNAQNQAKARLELVPPIVDVMALMMMMVIKETLDHLLLHHPNKILGQTAHYYCSLAAVEASEACSS